jgi:hypothetical protein
MSTLLSSLVGNPLIGTSGTSGFSGRSGFSGFSGSGISGFSGAGTSGFSGYSGAGLSGFSGISGFSGRSGFSGSGFSGYSGLSGYSGRSGFSGLGLSGFSGISGFSGRSGYSGWSGINGTNGTGGGIFPITGERANSLEAGQYLSFGAGANNPQLGTVIYVPCVIDALSFKSGTNVTSNSEIELYVNGVASGKKLTISNGSNSAFVSSLNQSILPGDLVNIRVNSGSGGSSYTCTAWVLTGGAKGESGFSGRSGFSGFSSFSGFSGFSGISGFSGTNGASGISGFSGALPTGLPQSSNTTIVSSDKGKYLNISSGVTINSSTGFSSGDVVSIYNNTAGNITVTATGVTLRLSGTSATGNRTIGQRGVVTILCVGSNDYVISGSALS